MISEPRIRIVLVASLLFFLSGAAALVYEVLWMKQLSLLFGNSAQAAAATLAAFFTGIAAGNAYWGRRASTLARPLLVYGVLELCVTLSAVLYFAVYLAYGALYPVLFPIFEHAPIIFTLAKFALALLLFFPAAFFMGGTLPVMTQYLVRNQNTLGKRASTLYTINTAGAASGAIAAGFYLPRALGVNNSYLLAMATTLLVAFIAIILGSKTPCETSNVITQDAEGTADKGKAIVTLKTLSILAWLSGFTALALQVLWIRMFAQVLHNSVYTYSAILATFLIALALGGAIARELARRQIIGHWVLPSLLTVTALLVGASPLVFHFLTDGSTYITGNEGFVGYLFQIFSIVFIVIGIPTISLGIVLPYLFKVAESGGAGPGETVGRLVTVNTIGAILGSIVAGFILLDWIGLWSSIKVMATLYFLAAFWLLIKRPSENFIIKLVPVIGLIVLSIFLDASKLPLVKIDTGKKDTLLKVWEGADATVAVVRRDGHLRTKLNNWYSLGGTADSLTQQMQSHLPLLLHPAPKRVFYLGLGSGITAGTALDYKVDEVIVTEIAPSVIQASKEFFSDHTNGLFDDPRVTMIAEDGRNVLRGSRATYDLIISDLFVPWKAGTGNLYSVDHYESAAKRLNDKGMYVQWLPLYQLTKDEFAIIARSMHQVFPMVSLWRANFSGNKPVVALIGFKENSRLSSNTPLLAASKLVLRQHLNGQDDTVPLIAHYAGTLRAQDTELANAPLNTDGKPVIEYLAPMNHRLEKAGRTEWFVGSQFLDFIGPYLNKETLAIDPFLSDISSAWYAAIQSGYYLQASHLTKAGRQNKLSDERIKYESLVKKAAIGIQ